jgi:putative PEP-CTERM system histidine kinase
LLFVPAGAVIVPLELLRTAGWAYLLLHLHGANGDSKPGTHPLIGALVVGLPILAIGIMTALNLIAADVVPQQAVLYISAGSMMVLTVGGLFIVEALVRQLGRQGKAASKFLLIGAGSLFAFDFFLYATVLLLNRFDWSLIEARGFATAFSAPLIAIAISRQREWMIDIHVSRSVVSNSFVILGAGLYLLIMALAGFAMREMNMAWGPALHVVFLAGAAILLIIVLSSGSARVRLRDFVSRNFFSNKYDYRTEWLTFSRAVAPHESKRRIEARVLDAVLETFSCGGGALWLRSEGDNAFVLAASRPVDLAITSLPLEQLTPQGWDGETPFLVASLASSPSTQGLTATWAAIPILHRGGLLGLLVLSSPAVARSLDAEDLDLMRAVGLQAASQLAEERLTAAVARERRFESFARRAAYATHDLKNIANQLSLTLQNWKRLEGNAEFRAEMPQVLGHAVERIQNLLESLKTHDGSDYQPAATFSLNGCLEGVLPLWRARHEGLTVELDRHDALMRGRRDHFESIIDQLLANACTACPTGRVRLSTKVEHDRVSVEISDSGSGLSKEAASASASGEVVASRSGFGIGLFQVRDYLRQFSGQLELTSEEGEGTTARIVLGSSADLQSTQREAGGAR